MLTFYTIIIYIALQRKVPRGLLPCPQRANWEPCAFIFKRFLLKVESVEGNIVHHITIVKPFACLAN